jgi:hypothetical protein
LDRISEKNTSGLPIWLLGAAALAALSARALPLALFLPFVLGYMGARFGFWGGAAGTAAVAAASIFSTTAALLFAAAFLPVSFAAAVAVRRRWRFRDSVVITSGAALAGAALAIALLGLLRGVTPAEYAVQRTSALFSALGDKEINLVYQFLRTPDIWVGAITQEAVAAMPRAQAIGDMTEILHDWIGTSLVPMMLCYALLWGLLCYLMPRRGAERNGVMVQKIPDFSDYALPGRFWLAFLVSYLAAAAADAYHLLPSGLLQPSVSSAYSIVFFVQALSFADYFYKVRGMSKARRVAMHTMTVLIFGNFLMWLGVFENIVHLRSRTLEKGDEEL